MDLVDLVPSLQRAVAPPGEFDIYFPSATQGDMTALLADSVAEAQLDGFLASSTLDVEDYTVAPDLNSAEQALIILYGMARILTTRIANLKNRARYKAGSAESETEQSASVLVELLKQTRDRKRLLLEDVRTGNAASAFAMIDGYIAKSIDYSSPDVGYIFPAGS